VGELIIEKAVQVGDVEMKSLAELGEKYPFYVNGDRYNLEIEPGENLLLMAGQNAGSNGAGFDHPNLVARKCQVFEFKHHALHYNGNYFRKWWTSKAGISFYFVVPKKHVFLVEGTACGYVKVMIGGQAFVLNVSGGTKDGWTNWIPNCCNLAVGSPLKNMKALAEAAILPSGKWFDMKAMDEEEHERWVGYAAGPVVRKALKPGDTVVLGGGYNYGGRKELEFIKRPRRKQHYICERDGWLGVEVYYRQINWEKTAEKNGIKIEVPEEFNRVGEMILEEAA